MDLGSYRGRYGGGGAGAVSRSVPEWVGATEDTPVPPGRGCSVPGCDRLHDSHGYCNLHAHRFRRHGDPLGGTTSRDAAVSFMHEVVLSCTDSECLAWPFGTNNRGYGVYHVRRRAVAAHVFVCRHAHGAPPTAKHEVAHNCGNPICCNPKHLRWATRSENHADKLIHGTHNRGLRNSQNRLTPNQVRAIRLAIGTKPKRHIARDFGVTEMTVAHIASGRTWSWLP